MIQACKRFRNINDLGIYKVHACKNNNVDNI
jgi:hypothetical protein